MMRVIAVVVAVAVVVGDRGWGGLSWIGGGGC